MCKKKTTSEQKEIKIKTDAPFKILTKKKISEKKKIWKNKVKQIDASIALKS